MAKAYWILGTDPRYDEDGAGCKQPPKATHGGRAHRVDSSRMPNLSVVQVRDLKVVIWSTVPRTVQYISTDVALEGRAPPYLTGLSVYH